MELFKIILFEYVLGYMIQGFTVVLGIYALNRQKINLKNYIFTSVFITITSCLVKLLPINFGIHSILNMVILFLICTLILKMHAFNTMRSAIIMTIMLMVIEMIYVTVMRLIIGEKQLEYLMLNLDERTIFILPITIIFVILTVSLYIFLTKKK